MKQRTIRPGGGPDAAVATTGQPRPPEPRRQLAPPIPLPPFRPKSADDQVNGMTEDTAQATRDTAQETTEPETTKANGRNQRVLMNIAVDLIDPNPLAPREVYTPEMILERAEALRTQGQHDPIHVIPHPDVPGRFIIMDGWTRVQGCVVHHALPELLAEVHAGLSLQEAAWFGYQQNEERQQHCDLDRASFYEKLIAQGETPAEVARRAKISKQLMSLYRSYHKLPEDVLDIIREHPNKFGANAADALRKVFEKCGARKAVALASKYAAEDQTVRWIINQAQAYLYPGARKPTAPSKKIRYTNGYYKQLGDTFEVSIEVPEDKRAKFAADLEALLDTVASQVQKAEDDNAGGGND